MHWANDVVITSLLSLFFFFLRPTDLHLFHQAFVQCWQEVSVFITAGDMHERATGQSGYDLQQSPGFVIDAPPEIITKTSGHFCGLCSFAPRVLVSRGLARYGG